MKSYIVRASVEADMLENGEPAFHASCPALKGCHTWGHTHAEAGANIREAIELYIDDLRAAGEALPVDPEQGAVAALSHRSMSGCRGLKPTVAQAG